MELPTIVLGSILAFGALLVGHSIAKFRHLRLDTVRLLPDEKTLFELHDAKYSELPYRAARYSSFHFGKCVVRVTTHRVLLAQRALFGRDDAKAVIRFALHRMPIPSDFGTSYLDGFTSFVVDARAIAIETVQGHAVITLRPESAGPPLPTKVMIETSERERLALYFERTKAAPESAARG